MTKTFKYNAETLTSIPFISWMKDPHALDWLKEYKAKKIAKTHDISIRAARQVIKARLSHYVKVSKENESMALAFCRDQGMYMAEGDYLYFPHGHIFFKDQELATAVKLFYS